jgi:hypothetical protein
LVSPNEEQEGLFGCSASDAVDVDNDGLHDLIVGAYREDPDSTDAGRAYVFSGASGSCLHCLDSPKKEPFGYFGESVSGAGDVNGDGLADLLVGAMHEDTDSVDAGRVYLYDGAQVPVELAAFRGEAWGKAVRLTWVTLTETDNLGFNVERSLTGPPAFIRLNATLIPGAGSSSEPRTYSYLDNTAEPATAYWYRLEDVSLSGERAYHGPIEVAVPAHPQLGLSVLGDSRPAFLLTFSRPGRASLRLHDLSGRLISVLWEGVASAGDRTFVRPADLRDVPPGLYTGDPCPGRFQRHAQTCCRTLTAHV